MDIRQMENINLRNLDNSDLADIKDVSIDITKDKAERLKDYIRQIKNPYCFKCGKVVVEVSYAETGASFQDKLLQYFEQTQPY